MELLQGIRTRRSIRAFKSRPIDRSVLEEVISATSNTPSYTNTQPWEIAIVAGTKREELAQGLYEAAQSNKRPRPHFPFPKAWPKDMKERSSLHMMRRFEAARISPNGKEAKRNQFLQNFLFFGAPVVFIIYMDRRLGDWSVFDVGLFVQNLVLAAHGVGLATCIQAMPVAYPEIIGKCLEIPSSKKIMVAVALGYEDETAPINTYRSEKKRVEDWVEWFGF